MPTHYEKLHVTENAPAEVIRAAYRALSLKHHPDKAGDRPLNRQRMQAINDAYAVLCDAGKRKAYDEILDRERHPPATPVPRPRSGTPEPVRRRRAGATPVPQWMIRLFLFFSDARIVIPVVAVIWVIILKLAYRK